MGLGLHCVRNPRNGQEQISLHTTTLILPDSRWVVVHACLEYPCSLRPLRYTGCINRQIQNITMSSTPLIDFQKVAKFLDRSFNDLLEVVSFKPFKTFVMFLRSVKLLLLPPLALVSSYFTLILVANRGFLPYCIFSSPDILNFY